MLDATTLPALPATAVLDAVELFFRRGCRPGTTFPCKEPIMRILVPILLVGLAACYSPRSAGPGGQAAGPYGGWDDEPLQASLWIDPYTNLASFDVNKAAHVAVFHWQPGRNFTLVYPAIGQAHARNFDAGRHHLWTRTQSWTRAQSSYRRGAIPGYVQYAGGGTGLGEPSYFVLLASEQPLDVRPFLGTGRSLWVNRVSWSYNPYTATELLASQIVPQAASTEWTAAYQVVWPIDNWLPQRQADWRWVQCDGITIAVPLHLLVAGTFTCPSGQKVDPLPEDSVDVTAPAQVAARIAALREQPDALGADRPSAGEVRSLIDEIRAARRAAGEEVDEAPVPSLVRRVDRARAGTTAAPTPSAFRPVIRPAAPDRAASPSGLHPPGMRTDPRSRQGIDRPRPHAESPRPAADRPRPDARRPRPQADRPAASPPRVERPQPSAPPARPAGERRPPPDASRD
jgi:hypothetical protein